MFRGVLISDLNYGGVELVFGRWALRGVWGCLLDVLFFGDGDGWWLLLLDYFYGRLKEYLMFLLGFGWAVCVSLYAFVADLLKLWSFVDGLIVGEAFFVGCQGVECEIAWEIVYSFCRDFWYFRNSDRN